MNWRNVRLIFLREVRDQLRDRRTLFMIAVLPLLLYPGLGVGIMQMTVTFTEQPRTVVILNAGELPRPQLLNDDQFVKNWFADPALADRLRVVTSGSLARAEDSEKQKKLKNLLSNGQDVFKAHQAHEALVMSRQEALRQGRLPEARTLADEIEAAARSRSELFSRSGIQVLIAVPDGMRQQLAAFNERIQRREPMTDMPVVPTPVVLYNVADEKSMAAYSHVKEVLTRWEAQLLRDRLRMADLPESLPTQINPEMVDLAGAQERSAVLWSKLFPALLVLMTVTGAFYPAVDLAAGEKERGTMETLLICPASRSDIVLGKFFTVMLFSVSTAILNLCSMGLTGKYMASLAGSGLGKVGLLSPPPLVALAWVAVLMIPLAALFSALCLALATFARSTKEGQYYLTPLLLVTIGLTFFCLSPAVEITPLFSVIPVAGVALILKELLASGGATAYAYLAPVLVSSLAAAALALWWAIDQFSREEVLFREAERFEPRLWIQHLLREKGAFPSFAEGGVCFVFMMLLQFAAIKFFGNAINETPPAERASEMMRLLLIQQLAIVATPAVFMALFLTRNARLTLRLTAFRWKFLGIALILPFALQPLSSTLMQNMHWFFGDLPPAAVKAIEAMSSHSAPVWLAVLAFALAPAVCEELAFRGFILSGFLSGRRGWLAILLSSLCFGIIHMIPQQVFNATLMGMVLGLIAVKSGSLWPGVLFHFLYNAQQVLLTRLDAALLSRQPISWLARVDAQGLTYRWPFVLICLAITVPILYWLLRVRSPYSHAGSTEMTSPPRPDQPQQFQPNLPDQPLSTQVS